MNDNYYQAIIGNGRTAALIEPDATISFCCLPDLIPELPSPNYSMRKKAGASELK